MKLGLCTGGGDCPGLNAAIRAVVKHAAGVHGFEVLGIRDGLTGLSTEPNQVIPLALPDVHGIIDRGGTILGTSNKGSPFRKKAEAARVVKMIERSWKRQGLDALIVIGGDGTQFMARHLVMLGFPIIGIPKTIDNDLIGSDNTIGFATAVDTAVDAAERLGSSADAHDRVMVLEVMGRDAGHIALHTGIAAGAHAVLLPEIPFRIEELVLRLQRRQALGRSSYLVVAAEGAHAVGGDRSFHGNPTGGEMLGGIGHRVAAALHERTGVDARATVLGHVQRGGAPNAADRLLATELGVRAVELAAAKKFGRVVGTRGGKLIDIPYLKISDQRRLVDLKSELIRVAEAVGVCLGRASDYVGAM